MRADAVSDPEGIYSTPRIDRLASEGVLFTRAFCHAPMTLPSHVSLFSSRLPYETGVLINGQDVPADLPLLAEWLAQAGYDTQAVISLATLRLRGLSRGFRTYDQELWQVRRADEVMARLVDSIERRDTSRPLFLFAHFSDPHSPYSRHRGIDTVAELRLNGEGVDRMITNRVDLHSCRVDLGPGVNEFEIASEHEFRTQRFEVRRGERELGLAWEAGSLREPATRVRVSVNVPENQAGEFVVSYWVTDALKPKAIPQRYRSEVRFVDRYVGELITLLEHEGLLDDSVIVFTSDHGESLGEHGYYGHVEYLTDEAIHVPLILKLPSGDSRRAALEDHRNDLIRHIDLVPTLLDLAGLPAMPGQRGASILCGERRTVIAETHRPQATLDKVCLRDDLRKMILVGNGEEVVTYDLLEDPGESANISEVEDLERQSWPELLRTILGLTSNEPRGSMDESTLEDLRALGY